MGSHGPTLLTQVRRTLLKECGLQRGQGILLAVSGGGDSAALLHALGRLRGELGFSLEACGVDHGLRSAAGAELDLAETQAGGGGIPFLRRAVRLEPGGNLMARARDARYAALREVQQARGLDFLATAHHAEDRAETVLIRLLRGSGPEGLAVLPPRADDLLRPMIRTRKAVVSEYLQAEGIPFAQDPSNGDPRYLRPRVRHELLPLMTELSPGIVEHLVSLAEELGQGHLPPIYDATGDPVRLGRSHRQQLRQAIKDRNASAHVLLPGDRAVTVCSVTGQPRLVRGSLGKKDGPVGDSLTNALSLQAQKPQK